jgi:AcrR family transcriptional regulator
MAKPKRAPGRRAATDGIVEAAAEEIVRHRGADVTIDAVAARAGCAKGLVHYHFRTKEDLLAAVAARIWEQRKASWVGTLDGDDLGAAIARAWKLVLDEAGGVGVAATALGITQGTLVGRSVMSGREAAVDSVAEALDTLLNRAGLRPTVSSKELALLLLATADGLGIRLMGSDNPAAVEPAWSAFWAGLLSLTQPVER